MKKKLGTNGNFSGEAEMSEFESDLRRIKLQCPRETRYTHNFEKRWIAFQELSDMNAGGHTWSFALVIESFCRPPRSQQMKNFSLISFWLVRWNWQLSDGRHYSIICYRGAAIIWIPFYRR